MLAESMHGRRVTRVRVHTTPWAERHAGYPICGEMYRVRTGPPDDRRRSLSSDVLLRGAERLNYWKFLVQQHRRISDVNVQVRFGNAFSLSEIPQDAAKLPLHAINGLARDCTDVDIEAALM